MRCYYFKDMRNIINIQGYNQTFGYMLEYNNSNIDIDVEINDDFKYFVEGKNIHLHTSDNSWFRIGNNWYYGHDCVRYNDYVPRSTDMSMVRLYFPIHSVDNYKNGVTYMITFNTWVGDHKIELGSYKFNRLDSVGIGSGVFEHGSNRYYDCIDFNIIDPYDIIYSDNWSEFRKNICGSRQTGLYIGSILNVTLYVVTDGGDGGDDNVMMIDDDLICGTTGFNIVKTENEYLSLKLEPNLDELGWKVTTTLPKYICESENKSNRLANYIRKTYKINSITNNYIKYELVAKNSDTIVLGPMVSYNPDELVDDITQTISWIDVLNEPDVVNGTPNPRCGLKHFFSNWVSQVDGWPHFEEGWVIQCSMTTIVNDEFCVLSNEIPITQEIFKYFVGWTPDELIKRHKIEDMEIKNYTLVNKVVNEIVQIDRPDNSKSNIIQPVFFKVKDAETLTIHPAVTENICVNLDDYKSKVKTFHLQIENCKFNQIGSNQYGILFKINGASLPKEKTEGVYYVLNENYELVTTGKYKYVS